MINTDMRTYPYYTLLPPNDYGQQTLSEEPTGNIKMAVYLNSQSTQDSILFVNAQYIGFTFSAIGDDVVIDYKGEKLKVLSISPANRLKRVLLTRWE